MYGKTTFLTHPVQRVLFVLSEDPSLRRRWKGRCRTRSESSVVRWGGVSLVGHRNTFATGGDVDASGEFTTAWLVLGERLANLHAVLELDVKRVLAVASVDEIAVAGRGERLEASTWDGGRQSQE